jgi:hypothetical protein
MAQCSLCEQEKPVFYLRFRLGPIVDILPQEKGKTGMCQSCLQFIGKKMSKNRSYEKIGVGKIYVGSKAPASLPSYGEQLERQLLDSVPGTELAEHSALPG